MPNPEAIVKTQVQDFLKKTGRYFLRMNSGVVRVRGGMLHLCPVGTADLLTFDAGGRCVWLEIKHLKGVQHEAQIEFQKRVTEDFGHRYVVVRSLEDVVKAVSN